MNRSFLVVSLLLTLGLALTAVPVQAQTFSFSGTLDTDPETLAASEPVKGNSEADFLLVEFFDPNCPHCQRFHPVMNQVLSQHGDQIRFFMQPVPLWAFSRQQMQAISLAKEKGKYYEMIDAQLTSPYAGKGGMTTGQIVALAEEIGIDPEWMRERINSSAKRAAVNRLSYKARQAGARQAGIRSTPTPAIGKKIVANRLAACIGRLIEQEMSPSGASA